MQLLLSLLALASLALRTSAASLHRRQGSDSPRLFQFRVFGAPGCSAENQGFYTVDQSDAGQCQGFANVAVVESVTLEVWTAAANASGCELHIYEDDSCQDDDIATGLGQCNDAYGTEVGSAPTWKSWQAICS